MKRLRRGTFNIVAGLSLLLLVATVVLWVRSYTVHDAWDYVGSGRLLCFRASRGKVARHETGTRLVLANI